MANQMLAGSPSSQVYITSIQLLIPSAEPFAPYMDPLSPYRSESQYDSGNNLHGYKVGSGLSQLAPLYRVLKLLSLMQPTDSKRYQQILRIPTFDIDPTIHHPLLNETIPGLPSGNQQSQHQQQSSQNQTNSQSLTFRHFSKAQLDIQERINKITQNIAQLENSLQTISDDRRAETIAAIHNTTVTLQTVQQELESLDKIQALLTTNQLLLSPSSPSSSWLYSDIPVTIFAQLERIYSPYDNVLDTTQRNHLQNHLQVKVWADIPLQTTIGCRSTITAGSVPTIPTTTIATPKTTTFTRSISQPTILNGDMLFSRLFQHECRIREAINTVLNYNNLALEYAKQKRLAERHATASQDFNHEGESDKFISDKAESFTQSLYEEKLSQLKDHIRNQVEHLTNSLYRPGEIDSTNNNNISSSMSNNDPNNDHHRRLDLANSQFLSYFNALLTDPTLPHPLIPSSSHDDSHPTPIPSNRPHVSLQILDQLTDLQPLLHQLGSFSSPTIPTSSFSTPHLQFLYKQNVNSNLNTNSNNRPNQQQQQHHHNQHQQHQHHQKQHSSTSPPINSNSSLITTPSTTRQIIQVPIPASSNAAFKCDQTQQSNQFTRLDNQLRFFGFVYDYQFVTFGFTFQLSHHIEVRIFKLCAVLVDKPDIAQIAEKQRLQAAAFDIPSLLRRRVGRPALNGAAQKDAPLDLTQQLDSTAVLSSVSGQLSQPFVSHYPYHNLTTAPAGLVQPHVHITPVPNAQWICEIRGLGVQAKLSDLEIEMNSIKQLIVDQINLYQ